MINPPALPASKADNLKEKLAELKQRKAVVNAKMKPYQQEMSKVDLEIKETEEELQSASREPRVSDHAVIRYLERKHGFNFEEQRKVLLNADAIAAIKMGAKKIKRDGYELVIKDNVIVTVVD